MALKQTLLADLSAHLTGDYKSTICSKLKLNLNNDFKVTNTHLKDNRLVMPGVMYDIV